MFYIGKDCQIHPNAIINVKGGHLGNRSIIRSGVRIEGAYVELGTESYLNYDAWIGGGSCWDKGAYLKAGCFLHMGWNSHVNIARGVDIGEECGIGVDTKIFSHGAYLSFLDGFPMQWGPVHIGSRVWLPNVWVNPGITIGNDVVVSARSLVNKNLPDGCLAGGIPAKVLKEKAYPKQVNFEKFIKMILPQFEGVGVEHFEFFEKERKLRIDETWFDFGKKLIEGPTTDETERAKNQLRRNGVRFKFFSLEGKYVAWE